MGACDLFSSRAMGCFRLTSRTVITNHQVLSCHLVPEQPQCQTFGHTLNSCILNPIFFGPSENLNKNDLFHTNRLLLGSGETSYLIRSIEEQCPQKAQYANQMGHQGNLYPLLPPKLTRRIVCLILRDAADTIQNRVYRRIPVR